jgi:predicted negative regulator of RcsB-dependent stress response
VHVATDGEENEVEGLTTEQEQIEQLRQWWRKNGSKVTTLLIVVLLGAAGTRYWMSSQESSRVGASMVYDSMVSALEQNEVNTVLERGGTLLSQYSGTPYAPLAAMALAKIKYEQGDGTSAEAYLRWVLDNARDVGVRNVARMRLARVLLADNKANDALNLLQSEDAGEFRAAFDEIEGDIYVALERPADARRAYSAALAAPQFAGDRNSIQMKLDDLGPATSP